MNWVKPEFGDFLVPGKKRLRTEELTTFDTYDSRQYSEDNEILEKLNSLTKYCPRKKEDLVVNKKKIEEIELYLKNIEQENTYLLVSGPPGSGKFRTISVLCKSLKIECVEWVSPMSHLFDSENINNTFYRNELELFEEFIVRASRYSSVLNSSAVRVVLVKDIPNAFCRNHSTFHTFLEKFFKIDKLHIIFILSDVTTTRNLFSEQIKMKFYIKNISFNPLTQKNVSNLLHDIVKRFNLQKVNPAIGSHLEKISDDCNGDIRNAIATLHFHLGDRSAKSFPIQKRKRQKGGKSKVIASSTDSNTVPDNKIDIFHGLGRILYAKRENNKLVHSPNEVADIFITSPHLFVGMLHENYLSTFSSIHDISKASQNLVTSDLLLQDWNINSSLLGCGISVAAFGLMTNNSKPIRKFQQFNRPQLKYETLIRESTNFIESCNSNWRGRDILLDIAPFAKNIPYIDFPHKDVIKKLGSFKSHI